jgi:phosphohistidine phosphatase
MKKFCSEGPKYHKFLKNQFWMIIFAYGFDLYSDKICRPMKKQLILLRHAQSAGKQAGQQDYSRCLTPAGDVDANNLGSLLLHASFIPQLILSSSSVRTRQTTANINKALSLPSTQLYFHDNLYEATTKVWLDYIHDLDEEVTCALLVGHNPVISQLASQFGGRTIDLPPAGLIAYEFTNVAWINLQGTGTEIKKFLNTH